MTNKSKYSVRLIDKDEGPKSFDGDSQVEVFVDVMEILVEEYNLEENLSLPYCPGKKRAILNSSPENRDGSEMNSFRELSNGLYINTNLNRGEKIRHITQLASECDLIVQHSGWE